MCNGPILSKMLRFSIPLMCSSVLQLLFNAADIIVVGQFVGPQALAAVGSTSALINLIVNLFIGIALGANVVIANAVGRGDREAVQKAVQKLMDDGTYMKILKHWGVESGALDKAEINPTDLN